MFDSTSPIRRGAIVSCRFPLSETPDVPGPAARPALVVRVFLDATDHRWKAIVAYGTSRDTRANSGFEIKIREAASLAAAGLHHPTRFTLSRMRILPINRDFFTFSRSGTPVLGYLDEGLIDRLDTLCDRLVSASPNLVPLIEKHLASVESGAVWASPATGDTSGFDGRELDRFFQVSMTGRRDAFAPRAKPGAQAPMVVHTLRRRIQSR